MRKLEFNCDGKQYWKQEIEMICDTFEYKLTKQQIDNIIDDFINDEYIWEQINTELFDLIRTYVNVK